MFEDIYETSACSAYNMSAVYRGVKQAFIEDMLRPADSIAFGKAQDVWLLTPLDKTTPPFAHPIIDRLENGHKRIVIDVRACTRIDRDTGKLVVTSATEYEFAVLRAMLEEAWIHGNAHDMMNFGPLPPKVFTRWISEGITRRLNLTPLEQLQVATICGIYYYQLFQNVDILKEESDRFKVAGQVARVVNIGADKVLEIIEELRGMSDARLGTIVELVIAIRHVVKSPRVESLSRVLLYAILGGSWFGANAREIVAVSLEHPPTFLAIVYEAVTNRTYHRSFMAQLVDAAGRRGDLGKHYVNTVDHFLKSINHV